MLSASRLSVFRPKLGGPRREADDAYECLLNSSAKASTSACLTESRFANSRTMKKAAEALTGAGVTIVELTHVGEPTLRTILGLDDSPSTVCVELGGEPG
jgi:hypothetical protein